MASVGLAFLGQKLRTLGDLRRQRPSSSVYPIAGSRIVLKEELYELAMGCRALSFRAIVRLQLAAKPKGTDSEGSRKKVHTISLFTSQIQTSKTAAAASNAVSPHLLRMSGFADCLVSRYKTTGRCPFEDAFTARFRSLKTSSKN